MTGLKVQSLGSLRAQMKAVARDERPAPADAAPGPAADAGEPPAARTRRMP